MLSEERSEIDIILKESRKLKDIMEGSRYSNGILADYLDYAGRNLDKETRQFLENIEVLGERDLIALKEKGLDLLVEDDPYLVYYWPALLPRLFLKLVHMFGYPTLMVSESRTTWFYYIFKYKNHIIELRDRKGSLFFVHMTIHPIGKEKETQPQEGAEEVLKEFAEELIWIAMNVTPLNYGGIVIDL
ncbi:MAG: hypothetical protein DRN92_04535 [Thermoproteota archaeon]|nr:MAG: hypothetical protein DRN92_04535 [Candidatus Korarchaeota archaeon]